MAHPSLLSSRRGLAAAAALLFVATGAVLLAMGRPLICTCGAIKLWHGAVQSAENSQHLMDWYSLTHISHGLLFFAALALVMRLFRREWPLGLRYLAALALEGAWEIAENTNAVIERYRSVTIDIGYFGDSVVNSLSDMAMMSLGFWLASRLPALAGAGAFVGLELAAFLAIRDSLLINIIQLIHPFEALRRLQAGA